MAMRRLQYLAVLPHPKWGIEPDYIGPFGSLSEAMRWGKAHGCPAYKTIIPPERWERMHAHDDDFISANADSMSGGLTPHPATLAPTSRTMYVVPNEARCLNCEVVIENEPVLKEWGFCTTSCEKEYKENRE